ncbi:MAG: hypothetical protein KDJ45_11740, partial [Hyphomicrobiaceae bacterium]|nr:hypothetical protein [Hyphomicrobiaceae bacterium]
RNIDQPRRDATLGRASINFRPSDQHWPHGAQRGGYRPNTEERKAASQQITLAGWLGGFA